jgi:heparan-alpha-glucosaminide N-acetyltransferase
MGTDIPISKDSARITSIDALRAVVMFSMIFVNDIAGVSSKIVPWWMRHYKGNGMTFVDLVFPAFLFIVGLSIPFALDGRRQREPIWKTLLHVLTRTLGLLLLGVMMVNEWPDSTKMGWSAGAWVLLMYVCAILAFVSLSSPRRAAADSTGPSMRKRMNLTLRIVGFVGLFVLAMLFRGDDDHRILTLWPPSIHHEWWGILGLIGWAYLVACVVYLIFGPNRTALLGCVALLLCLYPADRKGMLGEVDFVSIGTALGSHASITAAGVLLAAILLGQGSTWQKIGSALLLALGCALAALLLHGTYGINKNSATPSWCLWASAITALLWIGFYLLCDVWRTGALFKPLAMAGQNVLLAYLLSHLMWPILSLLKLEEWYASLAQPDLTHATARSAGCALVIMVISVVLNFAGLRLKL